MQLIKLSEKSVGKMTCKAYSVCGLLKIWGKTKMRPNSLIIGGQV